MSKVKKAKPKVPPIQSVDQSIKSIVKLRKLRPDLFDKNGVLNLSGLIDKLEVVKAEQSERYEFNWLGKAASRKEALNTTKKKLKLSKKKSIKPQSTSNQIIIGDNLDALKLLSYDYREKIKCIYIDPPYNKDKEFVYKDVWKQDKKSYQVESGSIAGPPNTELSGRYHSKWLSMMYARLLLARPLLKDTGVICISISDEEVHHIRMLCDEIFGEQNFEGHIHWRRRHNQPNDKNKMIGLVAEHIIVYSKDKQALKQVGVGKVDLTGDFSNPDKDPRGPWASKPWKVGSNQSGSSYVITNPINKKKYDEVWMGEEATYKKLLKDNRIYFPRGGAGFPRKKYYRSEREAEGQCANNWWSHEKFGHNQGANNELTKLFGQKNVFTNPKPKELIRGLLQIANVKDNDVVLDFFAGSGVVGQVVMEMNIEDGHDRSFILVQRPEEIAKKREAYKLGYRDLSEITIARNEKAIAQIREQKAATTKDLFTSKEIESKLATLGFKVFEIK